MQKSGFSVGQVLSDEAKGLWMGPAGLHLVLAFVAHIIHLLLNIFVDPSLSDKGSRIPMNP